MPAANRLEALGGGLGDDRAAGLVIHEGHALTIWGVVVAGDDGLKTLVRVLRDPALLSERS